MIDQLDKKRKEAILNAALKEFVNRGYDNASTNIIAKEAGISKALMFHYVKSKQELFFLVYDFFYECMKRKYVDQMNQDEPDLFERLRQSYLLQLDLSKDYAWILDLPKLLAPTASEEVNEELKRRMLVKHEGCDLMSFDSIDQTKFKKDLNLHTCKQMILYSNLGFTNQMLEKIRSEQGESLNLDELKKSVHEFIDGLKSIYFEGD